MSTRCLIAKGSPKAIKNTKKDFPKARIIAINIENGWIVVKWDKHSLSWKLKRDYGLKVSEIDWSI